MYKSYRNEKGNGRKGQWISIFFGQVWRFKTTEITLCNGENALINIYFIYQNLQIGN
jgi:hypothetical protein